MLVISHFYSDKKYIFIDLIKAIVDEVSGYTQLTSAKEAKLGRPGLQDSQGSIVRPRCLNQNKGRKKKAG